MSSVRTLSCVFSAIFLAQNVTSLKTKRILLNDPDVFNSKLLNLEKRINELETENNHLKQLSLGQRIQALETENSNLKQMNSNLGQKIKTIETENSNLGQKIQIIETENSNLGQRIQTLEAESNKSKQEKLGPRVNGLETDNSRLMQLVNTVSIRQSATFVRWGRKDCPSLNGTSLVYSGVSGGGGFDEKGGGGNMLCMPHNPDTLSVVPNFASGFARVYGTEYQFSYQNVVWDDDVPCAVCHVTTATSALMIPAKSSCPSGWLKQYNGMLVADYYGYATSEFVCVDSDPQYFEGKRGNTNGNLFYPAVGVCGTLPCPAYANNTYLPCVMCTK